MHDEQVRSIRNPSFLYSAAVRLEHRPNRVVRNILHSLRPNVRTVLEIGHDVLLPRCFQICVHQSE
jgi:hypothetical protein